MWLAIKYNECHCVRYVIKKNEKELTEFICDQWYVEKEDIDKLDYTKENGVLYEGLNFIIFVIEIDIDIDNTIAYKNKIYHNLNKNRIYISLCLQFEYSPAAITAYHNKIHGIKLLTTKEDERRIIDDCLCSIFDKDVRNKVVNEICSLDDLYFTADFKQKLKDIIGSYYDDFCISRLNDIENGEIDFNHDVGLSGYDKEKYIRLDKEFIEQLISDC